VTDNSLATLTSIVLIGIFDSKNVERILLDADFHVGGRDFILELEQFNLSDQPWYSGSLKIFALDVYEAQVVQVDDQVKFAFVFGRRAFGRVLSKLEKFRHKFLTLSFWFILFEERF